MFESCTEQCGWIAGIIAALSFGSFGVPIKYISKNIHVDPLVMQSYKSIVCFLTCWLIVPLGNEPVRFTYWGIVSGIFWVPGATAGIYGIRNAGLAVSVGIWSAIIVMSSFCWGIFVFEEQVKDVQQTFCAAVVLICGLVGMSRYSEPVKKPGANSKDDDTNDLYLDEEDSVEKGMNISIHSPRRGKGKKKGGGGVDYHSPKAKGKKKGGVDYHDDNGRLDEPLLPNQDEANNRVNIQHGGTTTEVELTRRIVKADASNDSSVDEQGPQIDTNVNNNQPDKPCGGGGGEMTAPLLKAAACDKDALADGAIIITRRQLGIIGAIINGAWGGNSVIPMHFARAEGFFGAGYLISFSVGSMIVTVMMWAIRYLYHLYYQRGNIQKAYNCLPSFHCREIGLQGFLAGILYSMGNFCSIIAISILGQGVGYSFVQTSMLISGLWGIFCFAEVQGREVITKWFLSSLVTITGILWLSYEHEGSSGH